ncbi:hypothetical protein HDU67_010238 [Dinochytrium kinnereticum]|nr:hypothetical protein HDU67_010238 [Dinochytrium kinnereticum]
MPPSSSAERERTPLSPPASAHTAKPLFCEPSNIPRDYPAYPTQQALQRNLSSAIPSVTKFDNTYFKGKAHLRIVVAVESVQQHYRWISGTIAFKIDQQRQARIVMYNDQKDDRILEVIWAPRNEIFSDADRVYLTERPKGIRHCLAFESVERAGEFCQLVIEYIRLYMSSVSRKTTMRR